LANPLDWPQFNLNTGKFNPELIAGEDFDEEGMVFGDAGLSNR